MLPFHPIHFSGSVFSDAKSVLGKGPEPPLPLRVHTSDSVGTSEWEGRDEYSDGIQPLLDTLREYIKTPIEHQVSPVAVVTVFYLLKSRLLPTHADGLCGLRERSVLSLNPFDFLMWKYNTAVIGEKWWDQDDKKKAALATPVDARAEETKFTLTRPWVKDLLREGLEPLGVVTCEWCYGPHFKTKCDKFMDSHRKCKLPFVSAEQWEELYKSFGSTLNPKKREESRGAFSHIVQKPKAKDNGKKRPFGGSSGSQNKK
jgi:hypothetical protein